MALTHATLIDLNANELILDLDADTSITADSDDTIDFKIGGSDEIKMTTAALSPASSDGNALGTAALEWSDLYLADGALIYFGDDQDTTLTHADGSGLTLNSTNKLMFNDASQFIQGSSATVLSLGATDEIDLTATLVDINANVEISGTATTTGVHTFTAVPVFPNNTVETADIQDNAVSLAKMAGLARGKIIYGDSSGDPAALTVGSSGQALVSDGTDISWGSGGAISTYSNSTNNRVLTSVDSSSVNSEANLTFDGSALQVTGTLTVGVNDTGHDVNFHGATSGCKLFWDESLDRLRVEGRTDGSDILIVTDNSADILNITSSGVVFNEDSGDRDFRVESDTQAKSLYLDGATGSWSMNGDKLTTFQMTMRCLTGDRYGLQQYGNNDGATSLCGVVTEMNGRHTASIADDASITITTPGTGAIFAIQQSSAGNGYSGALFHANYATSGGTTKLADHRDLFANSDTDGKVCCYISGYNNNVILKNRSGHTKYFSVQIISFSGQ